MIIHTPNYQSKYLQNILWVRKILVGKTLANDSQFAKFANIFPRPIIALHGTQSHEDSRNQEAWLVKKLVIHCED